MLGILRHRTMREGLWVAMGQLLTAIAGLVSIRVMTELLPVDEYGRFTLLVGVSALVLGLVATPKLQAVLRFYSDAKTQGRITSLRNVAKRQIGQQVAIAAVLLTIVGALVAIFTKQLWFTGALIAFLLIVEAARSFELMLLNAARRQRSAALVQAADAWIKPIFAICMVLLLGATSEAALCGSIIGGVLVVVLMYKAVMVEGLGIGSESDATTDRISKIQLAEIGQSIRRYALPLAPLAVFGWFSGMGDRYVIAGMLSMSDVGLYAAAYGLASRPFLMLSGIIEQTLRPVLHEAVASGDRRSINSAKRKMVLMMTAGAVLGVICFMVLSDLAVKIFMAHSYHAAADLMPWIAFGYAFLSISSMYSRICYAFDATGSILKLTVASGLTGVLVLVPAAMIYGLRGAVVAVPIRFAVELILSYVFSSRAEENYFSKIADGSAVVP